MKLSGVKKITVFAVIVCSLFFFLRLGGSNDLVVSLAELPGLAESSDKGTLVDLVKAMDEAYTEGMIKIEVYPFPRSINNVITGKADFHMPIFESPLVPVSKLPFNYISERIGKTAFVLYSHADKPITAKMIKDAVAKGGKFPYVIETANGIEPHYNFKLLPTGNIEQSFKKIESKRIDGLIWAQEETDLVLRNIKIKTIHREHLNDCEDTLLIQKGPAGDKIDKILSGVVKKLKKSGKLQELFLKIHKPYENWQPSGMGW